MSGQALGPLPVSGEVSSATAEPPDSEPEGPVFAEMDPTGRYGRFNEVLGRGACKVVYKAFDTEEGTEMAWNQVRGMEFMNGKDSENREERERIFAEVRVLKALKHKNIMSFRDSWYDPRSGTINFITELFTSGTLRQYRRRHRQLDPEVLKGWAWQILCGLVYLHGHSPPIIHRDLKCDNIFINGSDGVVKIGDLGLATLLRQRTAPQSVLGTPEFMAPELYEEEYDDRVDVYSFGMCLLELATMEYPYAECKNAAQIYRKVSLGIRPAGLQKVPPGELHQLINVCLLPREQRPRARTLLKHPFFESIRAGEGSLAGVRSEAALAAAVGAPADVASRAASASSDYAPVAESSLRSNLSDWRLNDIIEEEVSEELATTAAVSSSRHLDDLRPGARSPLRSSSRLASPTPSVRGRGGVVLTPERALSPQSVPSRTISAASSHASIGPFAESAGATPMSSAGVEGGATTSSDALVPPATASAVQGRYPSTSAVPPPTAPIPASPDRRFTVVGKLREEKPDECALRLRIAEPGGGTRTVEFSFDLSRDTAISVAAEMVEELALSSADAADIAAAIREEIAAMSSDLEATLSMNLEAAGEALRAGILHSANSANGVGATLAEEDDGQQRLDSLGEEEEKEGVLEEKDEGPAKKSGEAKPVAMRPGGKDAAHSSLEPLPVVDEDVDRRSAGDNSDEKTSLKAGPRSSSQTVTAQSETTVREESSDSSPQYATDLNAVSAAAHPGSAAIVPGGPMIRRASPPPLVVRRSTSYEAGPISASLSSGGTSFGGLGSPGGGSSGEATPHFGPSALTSRASMTELAAAARAAVLSSSLSAEGIGLTGAARDLSPSDRGGTTASSSDASAPNPPRDAGPPKLQALRQLFQEQQARDVPEEVPAAGRDLRVSLLSETPTSPLLAAAAGRPVAGLPPLSPTRMRAHTSIGQNGSMSGSEGRPAHLPSSGSLDDCSGHPDPMDGPGLTPGDQLSISDPGNNMIPSIAVEALDLAGACSPRQQQQQLSARHQASSIGLASAADAFSIEAFGVAAKLVGSSVGGFPLVEAGTSMSAPVSSLASRETSPQRENDERCVDGCATATTLAATNRAAAGSKAGPAPATTKDKELLRKAAADTMKAVELRALNLLEGGGGAVLGGRGGIRGTPMAACRAPAPGSTITAMAGPPLGSSNGMPNGRLNSAPLAGEGLLRHEASSNGGGAASL